jgi:oligopeptide transport system substrate-binding protein
MKRLRLAFFPIALALAAASSPIFALTVTPAKAEVVYHRGADGDPETLDPHKTSTTTESQIIRDLFEGLLIHDAWGKLAPGVAQRWDVSPDGRIYTFHLHPGAKWSNGEPVRASEFVFSFRRLLSPATGAKYAPLYYPILNAEKVHKAQGTRPEDLGVAALAEHTLEIRLERPTPYFLELLALQGASPVHPKNVQDAGRDFVRPGVLVSNGAFVLSDNVPNEHIVLRKNPHYHDAANVAIDVVSYHPMKDLAAAARRFIAGELHSTSDLPAAQYKALKQRLGDQVSIAPYLGTYYLAFNTAKKPFDDVRVRTALSMVIDREFVNEAIWSGTMVPAYGFIPPGIGNYGAPTEAAYKTLSQIEREEQARKLLKEAGYGGALRPLKVEIRYNTTENNRNTVVAIADMWKTALGVETTLLNTDTKTHFAHLRDGGDFDVARGGWIADYSDPQNFLFLFQSDNAGFNYARYKNPEFDALMRRAGDQTDLEERARLLHEADSIIVRDVPYAPILFYANRHLISSKLKGFHPNLLGANATRFMRLAQ